MSAKRKDIHRPSAIITADYEFVACMTDRNDADFSILSERPVLMSFMERTGATYANHDHGGTCMVCGAGALDYAVFHHAATNKLVCMGMDCAAKMDMGVDAQFRSFKDRVKAGIAAKTGKAKAQALLADRDMTQAWTIFTDNGADFSKFEEFTIRDLVQKLVAYGALSDKQWEFLGKLIGQFTARPAKEAKIEAEKAEQRATSAHIGKVGDRREFTLQIVATKTYETQYGPQTVNICKDEAGNSVIYKGNHLGDRGTTVRVKATVKAHDERDGIKQTIINRPATL